MNIGWVAEKRREKNLTQIQLSQLIEMSQATVSRIESGRLVPDFETIRRLAKALEYKGRQYSLIDAVTKERRVFNVIDERIVERRGYPATILITDDSCVLEIVGKQK